MEKVKILVTYYSRTGTTRKVAKALASQLSCDLEEMIDLQDRSGFIGYVRSMFDALNHRHARLKESMKKVENYDLVVIGTPVWAGNLSVPVRSFLIKHRDRFKNVAFFLTSGALNQKKVFSEMEMLAAHKPIASLELSVNVIRLGNFSEDLDQFIGALRSLSQKRIAG